jgi:Protein of unknown function (DUF2537)
MVAGVPLGDDAGGGRTWNLPDDLVDDLQEWARIVATLPPPGTHPVEPVGGTTEATVSRRGRHLAARLSVVLGAPVDYCDPVTGHRVALRAVTRTPYPPVALPPNGEAPAGPPPGEPTPWATGLTLAALVAGLVLLANLALAAPLITGLGPFGIVVDIVVVAGLVPALWLNRHATTWRWAVYGTFAGAALALPFLAVAALG